MNMKKVWILFLAMGLVVSCKNVKDSKEYKELEAQRDSLMLASSSADAQTKEMMDVINEVESNFAKIREAEKYLSTQSEQTGEMNQGTKQRVAENFQMINEILRRNRAQIDELNKKLASNNSANKTQIAALKTTIDNLSKQLEESAARLTELQGELAKRDEKITQLSSDVSSLKEEARTQSQTIQSQDKSLHTAYYVFGTSSELKEQKILSGGFLQSTKVLKDTFNKDYFLKIDIREVTQIPLYAKRAKLWSNHPDGTYQMQKGSDGNLVFHITDTQRFWSLTKYLIIEVN